MPTPTPPGDATAAEILDVPFTFDPARCNHMGKAAIDCPHCLRHRIGDLEGQVKELCAAGSRAVTSLIECEAERDALRAQLAAAGQAVAERDRMREAVEKLPKEVRDAITNGGLNV